jgi:putative tryptophan/tyrosine transport system substrate-binding protein
MRLDPGLSQPHHPAMDRRRFLLTSVAGALAGPLAAGAQQLGKVTRLGVLWPSSSVPASPRMESLRQGLRESGYIDGQNLAIELRFSPDLERLRELAAELVRLQVNVIVSFGDGGPRAAQRATTQIPIVAVADDMVGAGLATNLARPGGNLTGITILSPELSAKRLALLKEFRPRLSRVAVLWDPATPSQLKVTEGAAQSLGIRVQALPVRSRADLPGAFDLAKKERAEAFNVLASPLLSSLQSEILERVTKARLPAIYQWREHAGAGGLISYGPSLAAMWQQTGHVIAKILNGAKPGDLPVEQPIKFELVINLKTAKALGLTIPPSLLARADQVIE